MLCGVRLTASNGVPTGTGGTMQNVSNPVAETLSQEAIRALPSPPRAKGLPVVSPIAHIHGFMTDVLPLLQRLQVENGSIFKIRVLRKSIVFLLGPDATEQVLVNTGQAFSSELGWNPFIHRVFPGALMAMDGKEHKYHRGIMQSAFTRAPLANYLREMNPVLDTGLDAWMPAGEQHADLQFYPQIKQLTLDIAASAFMGIELDEEADRINRCFIDAVNAALAYIRWPIPPFRMWRGVRGRKQLLTKFQELIADKRAGDGPDLFSRLCHAKSDDGETYTDAEIIDHMIFVMMAAHDTSTSTMSTMAYLLAKHPEWQERLRAATLRYRDAKGDAYIDYASMDQLEELTWVAKEALRLYPPLTSMPRIATKDVEVHGYRIPKGQLVGIAPIYNHYDPSLWSAPETFDPERFAPDRAEDKNHRFAWVPFGGGMHKCIGQYFGLMEIRATMHLLLQKYCLSIPSGYEMPYQMVPIARPKDGLPLRIERLD